MLIDKVLEVGLEHHGARLDIFLAKSLDKYSRSMFSNWIKSGFIKVNNFASLQKEKLKIGDKVSIAVPDMPIKENWHKPQDIPLDIVFEDDELLFINKQAGLVVHPGAGNYDNTLVNALLYYSPSLENIPRSGIVHRLDKDTTGIMVVAKTLAAHNSLVEQLQTKTIQKKYYALVEGMLHGSATIETFIARHPRNRLKMAVASSGKNSVTHYKVLKNFSDMTLLDITLETGRTHQIRVHMAHMRHPIIGDKVYNKISSLIDRQALHAYELSLTHPTTAKILTIQASLAADIKNING